MPQASEELRAKWGGRQGVGEDKAAGFLNSRGYREVQNGYWLKPKFDHVVTDDEREALQFLIEEWDHGGIWQPTHRHFKGRLYRLLREGIYREHDGLTMVLYQAVDGTMWVRPHSEFFGYVPSDRGDIVHAVPAGTGRVWRYAKLGSGPVSAAVAPRSAPTPSEGRKPIDLPDDVW